MITAERMAQVDANAAALGVPRKQLMESSGAAVARAVRAATDPGDRVEVWAGRGNNGGDAFVAARFLDDRSVVVNLLGRRATIRSDIARENWDALTAGGYDRREVRDSAAVDVGPADAVVDALLGTGVRGAPREPEATAIREVNAADATVVSVDVPSGVDATTGDRAGVAVEADRVVTFHDRKPGLADLDATVTVADIGIPAAAERVVERGDLLAVPDRRAESHKGDHGDILVVGGGPYAGAPALAARGATRAGADLVRLAVPESVADTVQGYAESTIVEGLPGECLRPNHVDRLIDRASDRDAVVVGPGLGAGEESVAAVADFLEAYDGRAVVDADGLRAIPVETDADLVCTPHQGELRRMGGPTRGGDGATDGDAGDDAAAGDGTASDDGDEEAFDDWADRVGAFVADLGATLLVKGPRDVIAGPGGVDGHGAPDDRGARDGGDGADARRVRINRTGNPGMTVGGTGDVLAGAVGALLAADLRSDQAAAVGAYVVGRAGDLAVGLDDPRRPGGSSGGVGAAGDARSEPPSIGGYGLDPTDVADRVPRALWGDRP